MPKYPNLDKLTEHTAERFAIMTFLEWLSKRGISLGRWSKSGLCLDAIPASEHERLLYEYLGVDQEALECERRALIAEETARSEVRAKKGGKE